MIIVVYSPTNEGTILRDLGTPEYSYYFVLKAFRPVLDRIGIVVEVDEPEYQVDSIYDFARELGESCIFLSFSPPHRTLIDLVCPTIPVFAWELLDRPDRLARESA